jgi:hypothetical protein
MKRRTTVLHMIPTLLSQASTDPALATGMPV